MRIDLQHVHSLRIFSYKTYLRLLKYHKTILCGAIVFIIWVVIAIVRWYNRLRVFAVLD